MSRMAIILQNNVIDIDIAITAINIIIAFTVNKADIL